MAAPTPEGEATRSATKKRSRPVARCVGSFVIAYRLRMILRHPWRDLRAKSIASMIISSASAVRDARHTMEFQ